MSGARSPAASPRLPSPPPIAEDQTGPASPTPGRDTQQRPHSQLLNDLASSRRIRPGTRSAAMAEGPPLMELNDLDSPFQLTEHLKALHHHHTTVIEPSVVPGEPAAKRTIAVTRHIANVIAQPPQALLTASSSEAEAHALWLYELCRFLVQKVNIFLVGLFGDLPACSANTCPEMRASEWQYLCAVHDPPKSCCAIDYCCHTLDWAANVLTSPRHYPSRLALAPGERDVAVGQVQQMRQLTNIFRRVYRIFAHAWFQHREVFWRVEGRTGLYVLFKTVCDVYALIPEDNYTIPPEAEGLEVHELGPEEPRQPRPNPPSMENRPKTILRRTDAEKEPTSSLPVRRHKSTPSKGAPVDTVVEEDEDDDAASIVTASLIEDAATEAEPEPVPEPEPSTTDALEPETASVSTAETKVEQVSLLADEGGEKAEAVAGAESAKDEQARASS